ncbi:MAG TPA: phosphoribosylformylglycinamidine cyclo-ligase [Thermodesulfobium narugense]|nr:MAG: phosphoribosylformylglycinamidine cyclo-ligase [Thermodesulfobium narugense]HEM55181.1 phosphoribosylformylglycinamidine cyclo-ligase [Thermodesulfobium narugense]
MQEEELTYKKSGVNIESANKFVNEIKKITNKAFGSFSESLGDGFAGFYPLDNFGSDFILLSSCDGVGTKVLVAKKANIWSGIGQDLVAMNVNDILVHGGKPLFFLDYIACSKLDTKIALEIVSSIIEALKPTGGVLLGGETAEMPDLYKKGDWDLSGFVVGAVKRSSLLPRNIKSGNILIGLASNGVHSNGFSLIRRIIKDYKINILKSVTPEGISLAKELLKPTKVYYSDIYPFIEKGMINGLAHITGGGIEGNLIRILPKNVKAVIKKDFDIPWIFKWISDHGVSEEEMYRVFNMGIGMILVVNPSNVNEILRYLGSNAKVIGKIVSSDERRVEFE